MSSEDEVKRLLDDERTSEAMAGVLRELSAGGPNRQQLERLALGLGLGTTAVVAAVAATTATAAAPAAAAAPVATLKLGSLVMTQVALLKLGAVVLVTATSIGIGTLVLQRKVTPAPEVQVATAPAPVEAPAPVAEPVAAPVVEEAEEPEPEPAAPPRRHRKRTTVGSGGAASSGGGVMAPAPVSPARASSLDAEAALIDRAQAQLEKHPEAALELMREHWRNHPNGALAQEREVIAIDALLRLGRRGEAERRAEQFLSAHPGSALALRVKRLVQ